MDFCEVIPTRFERVTHSLEGCCSIQLSYGTIFRGAKIIAVYLVSKSNSRFYLFKNQSSKKNYEKSLVNPNTTVFLRCN
jgi:hypothetical protein